MKALGNVKWRLIGTMEVGHVRDGRIKHPKEKDWTWDSMAFHRVKNDVGTNGRSKYPDTPSEVVREIAVSLSKDGGRVRNIKIINRRQAPIHIVPYK